MAYARSEKRLQQALDDDIHRIAHGEDVFEAIRSQRLSLKDAFRKWDVDDSGTITKEEFRKGVAACGLRLSAREIEDVLRDIDMDHNSEIQYDEFLLKMRPQRSQAAGARKAEARGTAYAVADEILEALFFRHGSIEQTFRELDVDGNGWVSKKELRELIKKLPNFTAGASARDFNALWKTLDANGDGRVNWIEWLQKFRKVQQDIEAKHQYD